ncbi:DUF4382 domain-containing protein [Psychroserpens sp. XS_ASV72]|uniref:DUF4382 domain-containing protein n=1 Tax=Psychroserpens sp. XS_ASV72 TaxID=3241293 RepID=UPI003519A38E
MSIKRFSKSILYVVLLLVSLSSCSKQEESGFEDNSLVNVKLSATPSVYQSFNLDIIEVQLQVLEDQTDANAWISLNTINTGVQDVSQLRANKVINLVDFEQVPSDFIYSIKLVLGDNNTALKNGVTYDLYVTTDYINGSTNIIEKEFKENKLYDLTIELNIDESVNLSSENSAELQPKTSTLLRLYNLF